MNAAAKRKIERLSADPNIALLKFQTTGPLSVPLTTGEAAIVTGLRTTAIYMAAQRGDLKRIGRGRYMPDDLRAFMRIEIPKGQ